jgi:F-type H+-transporting ATPase subunit b
MENLVKPEFGLTFWTIVSFFILVFILSKFVWKPLLEAIEKRENKIKQDIELAQKAKDEANLIKNQIEERLKKLDKEIKDITENARKEANIEKEKIIALAQTQAHLIVENARKEAENYKKEIEKDIEKKIVEISSEIAKKVLYDVIDKKIEEKILELSLKESENCLKIKQL